MIVLILTALFAVHNIFALENEALILEEVRNFTRAINFDFDVDVLSDGVKALNQTSHTTKDTKDIIIYTIGQRKYGKNQKI